MNGIHFEMFPTHIQFQYFLSYKCVTQELKQINQNIIAELYAGYSKNDVTSIKEEQLKNNKYDSKVSQTKNTQSKQFAKNKDNTSGRGTKTGLQ